MIKIIKRGSKATKVYRITCKTCNSIFECEKEDLRFTSINQLNSIDCPVCHKTLYWGDGYPTDLCSVESYIRHVDY